MSKPLKQASMLIIGIIVSLGFSLSLQSIIAAAWVAPTQNAPNNTLLELVNVGASGGQQIIDGDFEVLEGLSSDGTTFVVDDVNNRVGIGTNNPTQTLDIVGNISLSGSLNCTACVDATDLAANSVGISELIDSLAGAEYQCNDTEFLRGNGTCYTSAEISSGVVINLSDVLLEGNSAGTSNINMNGNNLYDVDELKVNSIYDADGGNRIEIMNILDLNNNNIIGCLCGTCWSTNHPCGSSDCGEKNLNLCTPAGWVTTGQLDCREGCGFGGSTPYLFTYAKGDYYFENDIMNTFFQKPGMSIFDTKKAYKDNKLDDKFFSSDYYRLNVKPEIVDNQIKLKIKEIEPEESNIDRIQLLKIVHSVDSYIFIADSSNIYNANKIIENKPISCIDNDNNSCLDEILADDQKTIRKDAGEYMILKFKIKDIAESNFISITAWEKPFVPKPILSPMADGYSCMSIIASYLKDGEWKQADHVFSPRAVRSNEYGMIDVGKYLDEENTFTLKLEWDETHSVDKVGLIGISEEPYQQEFLKLVQANHSSAGDAVNSIKEKDYDYAHLVTGDYIDLIFDAGKLEPKENETINYFVISEGYYHGLRTYLYPDVDTSDAYIDDINKYIQDFNLYLEQNHNDKKNKIPYIYTKKNFDYVDSWKQYYNQEN